MGASKKGTLQECGKQIPPFIHDKRMNVFDQLCGTFFSNFNFSLSLVD